MLYRIIYLSSATKLLSDDDLKKLLCLSQKNNITNNITGLLLYIDGDFLQVIEGNKKEVLSLFELIKADTRNRSIITVFSDFVEKRQFPDWSMAFSQLTYNELQKNNTFKNISKESLLNVVDKIALIFIDTFVKSHKHEIVF